jgi:hypothetical protein
MRSLAVTLALVLILGDASLTAVVAPLGVESAPTDETIVTEATSAIAPSESPSVKLRRARPLSFAARHSHPIRAAAGPYRDVDQAFRTVARGPLIC